MPLRSPTSGRICASTCARAAHRAPSRPGVSGAVLVGMAVRVEPGRIGHPASTVGGAGSFNLTAETDDTFVIRPTGAKLWAIIR
jgi:hypothetical protein